MSKESNILFDKYAKGIFVRTEGYADEVRAVYNECVDDLLSLAGRYKVSDGAAFSFSDKKELSYKATDILRNLYSRTYAIIKGGIAAEWGYANLSADALIKSIFGKDVMGDNHFARYFLRNEDAMNAFFARTASNGGLSLSQRVWKYTTQLRQEMELVISTAMGEGKSASEQSRLVRKYLREPDMLFRRIKVVTKDKTYWRLSRRAKAYHPGTGVYRSSYKNAMRLTRTETNTAYRAADGLRWKQMDFVTGFEVRLSNHHTHVDICDDLKGVYPKDFKFVGWHAQCRCYAVPVLAPISTMADWSRAMLNGYDIDGYFSDRYIVETPPAMGKWLNKNADRIASASSVPYWIKDNQKYIQSAMGAQYGK